MSGAGFAFSTSVPPTSTSGVPPARSTSARAITAGVFVMTAVPSPRARSAANVSGTPAATSRCTRWSPNRSA